MVVLVFSWIVCLWHIDQHDSLQTGTGADTNLKWPVAGLKMSHMTKISLSF